MSAQSAVHGNKREIEGLIAEGPDQEMAAKLRLFGQFVGDWDILECRTLEADGTWSVMRGELHWGWILGGRAVQDVWLSIEEKTRKKILWGTTIRFYDPKIDAWRSTWIAPSQGAVKTFVGRQVGDEIVLEGKTNDGHPLKWIFSNITMESFMWRAEESRDNADSWSLTEQMRIQRQ